VIEPCVRLWPTVPLRATEPADRLESDPEEPFHLSNKRRSTAALRTFAKMPCIPVEHWVPLFDGAIDFGVLSGRNQPPGILTSEHKQQHPTTWALRSGIA